MSNIEQGILNFEVNELSFMSIRGEIPLTLEIQNSLFDVQHLSAR